MGSRPALLEVRPHLPMAVECLEWTYRLRRFSQCADEGDHVDIKYGRCDVPGERSAYGCLAGHRGFSGHRVFVGSSRQMAMSFLRLPSPEGSCVSAAGIECLHAIDLQVGSGEVGFPHAKRHLRVSGGIRWTRAERQRGWHALCGGSRHRPGTLARGSGPTHRFVARGQRGCGLFRKRRRPSGHAGGRTSRGGRDNRPGALAAHAGNRGPAFRRPRSRSIWSIAAASTVISTP